MDARAAVGATFDIEEDSREVRLTAHGEWVIAYLKDIDPQLRELVQLWRRRSFVVDLAGVGRVDTAGAYVLHRTMRDFRDNGVSTRLENVSDHFRTLFDEVAANDRARDITAPRLDPLFMMFERIGVGVAHAFSQARSVLGLLGVVVATIGRTILVPRRLRLTSLVFHMEQAGLDAVPIISLLTFLVGAVVAFLGAKILRTFGAEVFTVDLVGFAILRELGVLLTAIIAAGRSGSAFAAQIGSMKLNEEIDAMGTIGLDPIEVLVIPRVLAFIFMLPLLTFVADIMGLFGGIIVSWLLLDVSPIMFLVRLNEYVPINNFWAGIIKAPFFAFIIALIGCHEGLRVEGSAKSVGQHTTQSVVQAIFMVIVIDALFAMFYIEVDF